MQANDFHALEQQDAFVRRHIGPGDAEIAAMLRTIGCASLDELTQKSVPDAIRDTTRLNLPAPLTEAQALAHLTSLAGQNKIFTSLIGMGYHDCILPPVIQRNVLENPGWYTAYTPYQPEISQGRLEALLNFQTMIAELTGMDLANASMLDEGTAAAEAMALCHRLDKTAHNAFFVAADCHPQTIAVVQTRAAPVGVDVIVGDPFKDIAGKNLFGALLQYPTTTGAVNDYRNVAGQLHKMGALVVVAADPLALTLLTPPGEWGADVVVGSAQRFGVPLGFGGPHAGYLAVRDEFKRAAPGRIVGVSVDSAGRTALRLALQTREQHIRREKATSNICTAQVLLAVIASMYAVYHGPEGLKTIASRVNRLAAAFAAGVRRLGLKTAHGEFFDTVAVETPGTADEVAALARARGINLRRIDGNTVGVAFDETSTSGLVETLWQVFARRDGETLAFADVEATAAASIPAPLARTAPFLTHPVFNSHRSETEMMRYLKRLEDKDIALNRSMIALGSCTMKLNAAAEMYPISFAGFAKLHPFAPLEQAAGYMALIEGLERMLCAATGFDAVTLQPNAGSQGEYAGLLVIRAYHRARRQDHRTVCLIPSSAHGTNPASAVMAGMDVVVVGCDANGNIDVADLKAKAAHHKDRLAALMVTYPSTHGVYEAAIAEICRIVHDAGGQVYMDGANLNALVGVSQPGRFGPDVMHMNLHKTFCIPHGGGGPGVGPIAVAAHLAAFLPGHPVHPSCGGERAIGPVSAAPWGSPGILPISYAYMKMMGADGLLRATQVAVLNANYVAKRLSPHFPVLYTGAHGLVAHECIIDLRPLKEFVAVDDVAKRLMDYGFHAPTMSFPVAGTLMIEPTESESKAELDRFVDAMIAIRGEIRMIEQGKWPKDDNPLHNAPHTAEALLADTWQHPYARATAAYPLDAVRAWKYWPPVGRVDNVYGDRNLMCACPPIEAYAQRRVDAAE